MVIQQGIDPTGIINVAKTGLDALGMKAGATKVMTAGLGKTAVGTGTFWSGAGWSLGLGLGLGAWGPVLLTAVGTMVIYKVTPIFVKALQPR